MSALSDFYPLVRQRCAGVMDLMMDDALRDAYREFCEKSEFVTHTTELNDVTTGTAYAVETLPEHTVLKLESVADKRKHAVSGYSFNPISNEITFDGDHDCVSVVSILKPTLRIGDDSVNQYLANNYAEAIAAGAVYRLRMQVGTDWYNPDLAAFYEREFVEGCRAAYRVRRENFQAFKNQGRKRTFY